MKYRGCLATVLLVLAVGSVLGAPGVPAAQMRQLRAIYAPRQVEHAALAPDGRHVAFAVHAAGGFELQIFDTEELGRKRVVRPDQGKATRIHFLGWADAGRLVVVTETQFAVVDAAKGRVRKLGDDALFKGRARSSQANFKTRIIGLTTGPRPQLLVETNHGSDDATTVELYRIDVETGASERTFSEELPGSGGSLITDRAGRLRVAFVRGTLPQEFLYYPETGGGEGRDLDRMLANPGTFAFRVTVEKYLGERTIPLGFGADPNLLYFASNLGRDTYGLQAVDLETKQCTSWLAEMPGVDLVDLNAPWVGSPLVFDRRDGSLAGVHFGGPAPLTRWLDAGLAAWQVAVERDFPGRTVSLLEWDDARERALVLVTAPGDPGRYFVHDKRSGYHTEYFVNAPELDPELRNAAQSFAFHTRAGNVSGWLTWPQAAQGDRVPVVVWLHDGPLRRGPSDGGRDAQALATLGFAVLEINYAGVAGEGRVRREALRGGYDTVPVAEVMAALDWLASQRPFARDRVAIAGEGFGGYLALRAVQLQPETFRAAVAVNTVTDLADFWQTNVPSFVDAGPLASRPRDSIPDDEAAAKAQLGAVEATRDRMIAASAGGPQDFDREFVRWFIKDGRPLSEVAVTPQVERLTRPVFLLAEPDNPRAPMAAANALRTALRRLQRPPRFLKLTPGVSRAQVMREIADFLAGPLAGTEMKAGAAP